MQQPKIIFIASFPESLINFRLHLIKEFIIRNYSVVALAPEDDKVAKKLREFGVRYIPIQLERNGCNPFHDLLLIKQLVHTLSQEKPNIVFSYTIKPVIYGTLAARLSSVPTIFAMLEGTGYAFTNDTFRSRIIGKIARSLLKFTLRFNNKLFFLNKDNVSTFINHKLINTKQAVAIINGAGVDISHFNLVPLPDKLSFLMIARLLYDKGVCEYVAAARIIKNKYPHVVFKLVGWIDTNPQSVSQEMLDEWIESGTIEFFGKTSYVRKIITDSSVYVLPSYAEGTPRTVLEAMAMGRPIITTDVPGCRETVIDSENGFLVQVRNVEALSHAMEYFIKHSEEIKKMGAVSRRIAEEKYDVNKVNECILKEMEIPNDLDKKIILETAR